MTPDDGEIADTLRLWLPEQRWFAGKGATVRACSIGSRIDLGSGVEHVIASVMLDTGEVQTYQVPLLIRPEPQSVGLMAQSSGGYIHDGLMHAEAVNALLASGSGAPLDPAGGGSGLAASWLDGRAPEGVFQVLRAEQSNTSVVIGDSLVKFYRRIHPGINPDVELHAGLAEAGCTEVDELRGWMNGCWGEQESLVPSYGHMAIATAFLAGAESAAELAEQAAVSGRDFTAEARSMGHVLARVHACLAQTFGTEYVDSGAIRERAHSGVESAAARVPQVAALADPLHRAIDEAHLADLIAVQRIHGDLHLAQYLFAEGRWHVVDFEGEPAMDTAQRRRPDSPLRDVAMMTRSFEYVPGLRPGVGPGWVEASVRAFQEGYAAGGGPDPRSHEGLQRIYMIERSAAEALYEFGNRPALLSIPLAALRALSRTP